MPKLHTYLTMSIGRRAGNSFVLAPSGENQIGRGTDCRIVLTDPLCSRVHATIAQEGDVWRVRDAESRNGTFVNGQKVDDAVLAEGHYLRVGSTEFIFHQSHETPPSHSDFDPAITQTVLKETRTAVLETGLLSLGAVRDDAQTHDLLLLYQLSIGLLACSQPNEVLTRSLDLLRERTSASLVGFLSVSDDAQLIPKLLLPAEAAAGSPLSDSLTRLVLNEGQAIWIANQRSDANDATLQLYDDALCVPLVHEDAVIGAVHLYLNEGRFHQADFDFAISLANIVARALARAQQATALETSFQRLREKSAGFDELLGDSPPMVQLKSKIERLGRATGCVLIRGESGVGKELVARALHRCSQRANQPMLSVNCAAIPADLMESQLFGHRAGAFTGADRDHLGYFQQADLGTLFLDEVGEMTLQGQAKLLRILEGHPFLPVGGNQEVRVDVRVVAATNQDLQAYVRDGKFREDLYYRLSVFELFVPPLRQRDSDIGMLIDYFLEHFRQQHGRPGLQLAPQARDRLLAYPWPGNVRQLRNVIDSAVVLASGNRIEADDLGLRDVGQTTLSSLRLDDWEQRLIKEALERTAGNIPEAAKLLGIGRATLYRKVDELGITK